MNDFNILPELRLGRPCVARTFPSAPLRAGLSACVLR